jgi:hypothetical protein
MLIVGLSQAIFVPSAAQLHLSFSSPHSERLVGSFSLSHFDRRTDLPERLSMPLLTLPSHVASPIARAVQIGLPVRAPRSGCCHFVGSAGSSRLRTGTTGWAVMESSGLCSVIRVFGMPIAARLLCQQVLSVTCSPLRWHARRCCARAGPYPDCRVQVCLGPTSALKSQGQLPLSLHHRGARGCTGPLAADLSNRTRRAVGAKDARTTRTPPGLRRGQA